MSLNIGQHHLARLVKPAAAALLSVLFAMGIWAPVGAEPAPGGTTTKVDRIFYQRFSSTKWQPENCPSDARYHTNYGCVSKTNDLSLATLYSARPDGSDEQPIEIACTGAGAHWLAPNQGVNKTAVDAANGKIYWENDFEPAIARTDLDGSNCELIANGGYYGKVSIALDDAGRYLYSIQHSSIRRIDTTAKTIEYLSFSGLGEFTPSSYTDMAVAGDTLYVSMNNVGGAGYIMAVSLNPASTEQEASLLLTRPAGITSVSIDSVHSKIYWATGTSVQRANLADGSDVETVATGSYSFAVPSASLNKLVMGNRGGDTMVTADLDGQNPKATSITSAVIPTIGAVPSDVQPQTVTWSPTTSLTTDQSPATFPAATTTGDGAITYSVVSAGTTGCTVDESIGTITFTAAGECQVRATAAETADYSEATKDVTFEITAGSKTTPTTTPPTTTPPTTVPATSRSTTDTLPRHSTTSPDQPAAGSKAGATYGEDTDSIVASRTVAQGASLTVSGWGFAPGSPVEIWLHSSPTLLKTTTAGSDGFASATISIPKDAQIGSHSVKLAGTSPDGKPLTLSLALEVTPVGQLAFTGNESGWLAPVGLTLLVSGAVLCELVRRRRLVA